ncbi:MAG TPA: hypothetical protein VNX88_00440 [Terriglobales bacterium]|jgi:hypothetical protein|nr:hypothetical protein [Terriglobales bacterium]
MPRANTSPEQIGEELLGIAFYRTRPLRIITDPKQFSANYL